jgi:hypothetical protein
MLNLDTKNAKGLMAALGLSHIEQQINNDHKSLLERSSMKAVNSQILATLGLKKNLVALRGSVNYSPRRSVSFLSTSKLYPAASGQGSTRRVDPRFVTGFTDAEGYFSINVVKAPRLKLG